MNGPALDIPVGTLPRIARRLEVVEAMRAFYARADRLIALQRPVCSNKGECCRFGRFGHRLYVTALEVCYYLASNTTPGVPGEDACPHAYEGKCHIRDSRPLGCRVFYCDKTAQAWQGLLTEDLLARLRAMHDELVVPYFYVDWMIALRALRSTGRPPIKRQHRGRNLRLED